MVYLVSSYVRHLHFAPLLLLVPDILKVLEVRIPRRPDLLQVIVQVEPPPGLLGPVLGLLAQPPHVWSSSGAVVATSRHGGCDSVYYLLASTRPLPVWSPTCGQDQALPPTHSKLPSLINY